MNRVHRERERERERESERERERERDFWDRDSITRHIRADRTHFCLSNCHTSLIRLQVTLGLRFEG
jgi:hypothetical protein